MFAKQFAKKICAMIIETLDMQLTTEFKAELKIGDSSSVSSPTRVSSFDSNSVSPLDYETQDAESELLSCPDTNSFALCDLCIEPSDTVLPRQWFCPSQTNDDLGPVWEHQLVHETITSLESYQITRSVCFLEEEDRIDEEFESFESNSSMKDVLYRTEIVEPPPIVWALESSPIVRSERILNELQETSQETSFNSIAPIERVEPTLCDGSAEEGGECPKTHVPRSNKLKRPHMNWIRRLFCFAA